MSARFDLDGHVHEAEQKRKNMKLTLKNARRLDQVIREKIQNILSETHGLHMFQVSTSEVFADKLVVAQQRVVDTNTVFAQLSKIRHAIRRSIEVKNEACGLNTIMNSEAELRELIQFLEANARQYGGSSEPMDANRVRIVENKLDTARKLAESGTQMYTATDTFAVQDIMNSKYVEELETELRRLYTELNELKDSCAFKNSDPANSINLDDRDVEFLKKHRLM